LKYDKEGLNVGVSGVIGEEAESDCCLLASAR
jgi:hypothetical protein